MKEKIGLTLGKFAPLHLGHQQMIETAIRECDHLLVVVYDAPETTPVPLNIRAGWIRALYPEVEVIEGWNGPSDMGDTPEIKKLQEDYILGLLNGRKITHFYSSEFYGQHMSQALGAINRQIDPDRQMVSVSATAIRQDLFGNRKYLNQLVYHDLIVKAVFLGAPSTGKTTIAEQMARRLDTAWMPEYGREYWEKHQLNRRLSIDQLVEIAEGHLEREKIIVMEARNYLFCDTNAITTFLFSHYYHQNAAKRLDELAREAEKRYDLVFVCNTDIPYDDTWDRSGDVNRSFLQQELYTYLEKRNINYYLLSGTLEERIDTVLACLEKFNKFSVEENSNKRLT